jgi:hypothetical protein
MSSLRGFLLECLSKKKLKQDLIFLLILYILLTGVKSESKCNNTI